MSTTNTTQFQKSPPTPADSELWKIGKKWRTSAKGIDYTELDNIMSTDPEIEIESLLEAFDEQLAGKVSESIQYVGHYLVASHTQDGKTFVYGYPLNKKDEAEKKASYNTGRVTTVQQQRPRQQPQNVAQQIFNPQQSNTAASSTLQIPLQQNNKPTFTKSTIEVPFNMRPIAWDDSDTIKDAEQQGLYPLPVKHVGVENFGFIGEESGKRMFWWGKIKLVEME